MVSALAGIQEGAERPWWRKVFGGPLWSPKGAALPFIHTPPTPDRFRLNRDPSRTRALGGANGA